MPPELVTSVVHRSPADILRLVVAAVVVVLLLLVEWLFGDTLIAFVSDLLRGLAAIPQWIINVVVVGTRVICVVVLLAGLVWTVIRSGLRMLVTEIAAIGVAVVLVALLSEVVDVDDGAVNLAVSDQLGWLTSETYPSMFGIAGFAAALTAGAPWLARNWRRWGWVAVGGLVVTRLLMTPASFDSFESVIFGWFAGAAALVALGAPSRRATSTGIISALGGVGLELSTLDAAGVDARGSTPFFGSGPDGSRYFVKALGQDQRSADLLFRLYRGIQRKDLGDERPFSSLRRAVEHEAFVALAAGDLGIRTPRVRAFAEAEPNTFILAYDAVAGRSLDRLEPAEITDELLSAIWGRIAELRSRRIAHRDLRLANLFRGDDGEVWMIDFGFSEVAASDLLLANDVAELYASSSVVVGAERAAAPALATVDPDTIARARDRLHPWALSGATRTALKQKPGLLDDLRGRFG